ncbi:MAG: hypothetical protein U0Z44_09135 [Kouleothrix sp.]
MQIGNASLGKAYLRRYDHLTRQVEQTAAPQLAQQARARGMRAVGQQ